MERGWTLGLLGLLLGGCAHAPAGEPAAPGQEEVDVEEEARALVAELTEQARPLFREMNLAYWEAATTGDPEAYERSSRAELALRQLYSSPETFERLRELKDGGRLRDPLLARQVELLYESFAENQVDADLLRSIVEKSTAIANTFNTFRGTIDGRPVSANEIAEILKTETDSEKRRAAWEASKQVGPAIADELRELARLRNRAAQEAGFSNYYDMRLILGEQDPEAIEALFEQVDRLTAEPFHAMKAEMDRELAERYGVAVEDLRPWHYADPFFQEAPVLEELDLDAIYAQHDVLELARRFYEGIGLEVGDIIERSDLYARDGKDQSAFCTDIDREGDVRVLANLENDTYWMDTILHELGHAVYFEYIDRELPWLLRDAAHSFVTEGVALWAGRLAKDPAWIASMVELPEGVDRTELERAARGRLHRQMLVFARWSLVMVNFERALYADPDQDLDNLWWDLVERYQELHRPDGRHAPDWATKTHFVTAPVYYHNYMMGEMFASQLQAAMARELFDGAPLDELPLVGRREVGDFLRERVFEPGMRWHWDELIERATGSPLSPEAFVEQFGGEPAGEEARP